MTIGDKLLADGAVSKIGSVGADGSAVWDF
jgi:hypothetical protein